MKKNLTKLATIGTVVCLAVAPSLTFANGRNDRNEWNGVAIGAAAVGLAGILTNNGTLATIGLGGTAYSVYRADTVRGYDCHRPVVFRRDVRVDRHDFRR
jgi:hypothetical protein